MSSTRFTLLHLDHGEFLLESALCQTSAGEDGRLWISTRSLTLEMKSHAKLLRIPYKFMETGPCLDSFDHVVVRTTRVVEQYKTAAYAATDGRQEFLLRLKFTKPNKLCGLMDMLWRDVRGNEARGRRAGGGKSGDVVSFQTRNGDVNATSFGTRNGDGNATNFGMRNGDGNASGLGTRNGDVNASGLGTRNGDVNASGLGTRNGDARNGYANTSIYGNSGDLSAGIRNGDVKGSNVGRSSGEVTGSSFGFKASSFGNFGMTYEDPKGSNFGTSNMDAKGSNFGARTNAETNYSDAMNENAAKTEDTLDGILQSRLLEPFDRSRLVDFRERVLIGDAFTLSVDRVESLVNLPGCLLLTTERIYFQPARLNNVSGSRACTVWLVQDVKQFYRRRYMMQPRGLEITFADNSSVLFAFRDDSLGDFHRRLQELTVKRIPSQASRLEQATTAWQKRELDNFGYLQVLNAEADRSKHDLAQYPVFPWVLRDYTSLNLDLNSEKSFRDLSKPIGALDANRLAQFKARYLAMDPAGDPPPFLYGTHYSSPGFVLFFLCRERPEEMLMLQSGKFDSPDRMFHSVAEAWKNVLTNPADVKELIPEFYDGDGSFLLNTKRLDFGKRSSDNKRLNDVELPPWAKNSPTEFIAQMRKALEADYVSEHLQEWIDLIFGVDQRNVEKDNVFFHLTYQSSSAATPTSDMDETSRKSNETQIMEFGQTPKQLFFKPHPSRRAVAVQGDVAARDVAESTEGDFLFSFDGNSLSNKRLGGLTPSLSPALNLSTTGFASPPPLIAGAATSVQSTTSTASSSLTSTPVFPNLLIEYVGDKEEDVDLLRKWNFSTSSSSAVLVGSGMISKPKRTVWCEDLDASSRVLDACASTRTEGTFFAACKDGSLLAFADGKLKRRVRLSKMALSCVTQAGDDDVLVGSWDNALYRYSFSTGRISARIENAHDDAVSCCSSFGHVVATGGWDACIKLWRVAESTETTCSFYDHTAPILDVALSQDEQVVLSCDEDSTILIHDPRAGHDAVWSTSTLAEGVGVDPNTKIRWLSSRRKFIALNPTKGLFVFDTRNSSKQSGPVQRVGNATWKPRSLATDGTWVMVGDSVGRVTASHIVRLEQIPFESSVVARHDASPVCVLGGDSSWFFSACEKGKLGLHSFA